MRASTLWLLLVMLIATPCAVAQNSPLRLGVVGLTH
jgi:hypothetical protein